MGKGADMGVVVDHRPGIHDDAIVDTRFSTDHGASHDCKTTSQGRSRRHDRARVDDACQFDPGSQCMFECTLTGASFADCRHCGVDPGSPHWQVGKAADHRHTPDWRQIRPAVIDEANHGVLTCGHRRFSHSAAVTACAEYWWAGPLVRLPAKHGHLRGSETRATRAAHRRSARPPPRRAGPARRRWR